MAIIEGIRVTVYKKIGTGDEAEYSYLGSQLTDENGDYSIGGLSAGTYRLKFNDPAAGFLTEYYDGKSSLDTANDIAVTGATTVAALDVILGAASYVEGNVTDGV
jgi:hypothetical protein